MGLTMATLTKKDLLEAIDKKLAEIYQEANDPFNKNGDYYFGFQEGLEFTKELIKDLC